MRSPSPAEAVHAAAYLPTEVAGLDSSVAGGVAFLCAQAENGFPDARHEMRFPRRAGFRVRWEHQSSDVFARAVLGDVLLDIAALLRPSSEQATTLRGLAVREAAHIAASRLRDRHGGWSYFPDLPELPPDIDSLAAALTLFARAAPEHAALCRPPIEQVLLTAAADGAIETWILDPRNHTTQLVAMRRGVKRFWGQGPDIEVCARFYAALWLYDREQFAEHCGRGAAFVASHQQGDGSWSATWYWGPVYGTGLALQLLHRTGAEPAALSRGVAYLQRSRRRDGGWGVSQTTALDTALAIWALDECGALTEDVLDASVQRLLERQDRDGSWLATPWIKMDVGRASRRIRHTLTWGSTSLTCAFCVRALLLARRYGTT